MFVVAAMLAVVGGGGCKEPAKQVGGEVLPAPEKVYGSGPGGLKELWTDILDAAKRDERGKVHDLFASMIMTDDDMVALFGSERAAYLKPRYAPMIARLVNIGGLEFVAQVEDRKLDDVEVFAIEASQGPEQKAMIEALGGKVPVFGVRVKKKNDTRGLRYDFFVYRDARWVTGNQIAKYLVPDGAAAPSGAVPAVGGAEAPSGGAPAMAPRATAPTPSAPGAVAPRGAAPSAAGAAPSAAGAAPTAPGAAAPSVPGASPSAPRAAAPSAPGAAAPSAPRAAAPSAPGASPSAPAKNTPPPPPAATPSTASPAK